MKKFSSKLFIFILGFSTGMVTVKNLTSTIDHESIVRIYKEQSEKYKSGEMPKSSISCHFKNKIAKKLNKEQVECETREKRGNVY